MRCYVSVFMSGLRHESVVGNWLTYGWHSYITHQNT